jgi:hypothetical protein
MANSFGSYHCYLDTFTEDIDFSDYFPAGLRIISIEWSRPNLTGDVCIIRLGSAGPPLIEWECAVAGERRINFYEGVHFEDLFIDRSEVASGVIIIRCK